MEAAAARAPKPALISVDDDPAVARAVQRDLRRRYGQRYQVVSAQSGEQALEALGRLVLRSQAVALLLADQRMPGMSGVEFLERAKDQAPRAKRVLLTAYADTQAAIKAINDVGLNYYLTKPWDPPEDNLYPVLDDLLETWQADASVADGGLRVIGHRFSLDSHRLKDFLARNQIPHRWLDVERDEEAHVLLTAAKVDHARLPLVVFPDGEALEVPDTRAVAERVGLATEAVGEFYDLVIVGAGPAGLAGAVYGASEGLETVLAEREAPGGQAGTSSRIENYLGFPTGISGQDLAARAQVQAQKFGARIAVPRRVRRLDVHTRPYALQLDGGERVRARSVVVATGARYRRLSDVPEAERFEGNGIHYAATAIEAGLTEAEPVVVVGGGNSAGQAVVFLSRTAAHVHLLVRGPDLAASMSDYLVGRIEAAPERITVHTRTQIVAMDGDRHLKTVTWCNRETGVAETQPITGVFLMLGAVPNTEWLDGAVALDESGFVCTGGAVPSPALGNGTVPGPLESSCPGVFAVGDVRADSVKRVASGVGEGSVVVSSVHHHLARTR